MNLTNKNFILKAKAAMIRAGAKLTPGNPNWGTETDKASYGYDFEITATKSKTPQSQQDVAWMKEMESIKGKKETDQSLVSKLNPMWVLAKLPGFKGLSGSARAWCAIAVIFALTSAGLGYKNLTAAAISGDNFGVDLNWKVDGIPRGAIVRINHKSDCKSKANNHIGYSNGNCAAKDIIDMVKQADGSYKPGKIKSGATFAMLGGNQGDMVKVSSFPVNDICSVSWPTERKGLLENGEDPEKMYPVPLPDKIETSNGCTGSYNPSESTR